MDATVSYDFDRNLWLLQLPDRLVEEPDKSIVQDLLDLLENQPAANG